MSRESRRRIVEENLKIFENGSYVFENEIKNLKLSFDKRMDVEVFSPARIEEIMSQNSEPTILHNETKIEVREQNSFEASHTMEDKNASVLVMSFANANNPGGGFLKGANAQEEVLCRQSSLYQSISNPKAKIMYETNSSRVEESTNSDYMLISPNVEVFRLASGEYLEESFITSVISLPAPNVRGIASKMTKLQLSAERRNKLRKAFSVAFGMGYDTLVLGPWGCGAYGNEVLDVANDMRAVLMDDKMAYLFKNIIFAVHDTKPEKPNYTVFREIFRDGVLIHEQKRQADELPVKPEPVSQTVDNAKERMMIKVQKTLESSGRRPEISEYPFPTLHWNEETYSSSDFGYIRGYFSDKRFFYAELYGTQNTTEVSLNLVFSAEGFHYALEQETAGDRFINDVEHMLWKKSVLTKNLPVVIGGYGEKYINYEGQIMEYLLKEDMFKLLCDEKQDYQMYLTKDDAGEYMVVLSILLKSGSTLYAKIGYDFVPFCEDDKGMRVRFIVEVPDSGTQLSGENADVFFTMRR